MSSSKVEFERWFTREDCTWSFLVFQKHNAELTNMFMSHLASSKFTYSNLGKTLGAKMSDPYEKWFPEINEMAYTGFFDVQAWSDAQNQFSNWVNLNCVMAMSANLETYMATVVSLALESDVGVLYGASRRIDGMEILKYGREQPFNFDDYVIGCTKGDWSSRIACFEKTFGACPLVLKENIKSLEALRKLRNNVGHAFGRDIEASRQHDVLDISQMASLKTEKTIEYLRLIYKVAKDIDKQLFVNNIGAYQDLLFFHKLKPTLSYGDKIKSRELGNHAAIFKKTLNSHAAKPAGKIYCRGLINYYEGV
ncbi:hypothetical protein DXJ57_03035 [Vibrio fluvialis]|nr:hypothetical protein [Vibrio fluvialis]